MDNLEFIHENIYRGKLKNKLGETINVIVKIQKLIMMKLILIELIKKLNILN